MTKLHSRKTGTPPYLVDDNLYRGPYPDEGLLQQIQHLGVIRLVTLCDEPFESRAIKSECKSRGLQNFHIPLSPFVRPRRHEIANFLELLEQRHKAATYVHCIHGRDRTGSMLGIFRLSQGWPLVDALDEMKQHGFGMEYGELIAAVRDYSQF